MASEMVSLDFVEGLTKSRGHDTILVVIDRFTKYGHFLPLLHPFTALQVAQLFINNIYHLHGLPQVILSDRDRIFTSTLWRELFQLTDTALHMSSSYHSQTDGLHMTEHLNQYLESYLCCAVHACPTQWGEWLPLAKYWYNTTYHSTLDKTLFEILYGHQPRHLGISAPSAYQSPDLVEVLRQQLSCAQRCMKIQADKKRSERQFEIGDQVYLKLQPFIQQSVATRSNQKLFGPYMVLARVGATAYRLQLPDLSKIHPVVHVSLLKKHGLASVIVSADQDLASTSALLLLDAATHAHHRNEGMPALKRRALSGTSWALSQSGPWAL
jgi:hypothetical protein